MQYFAINESHCGTTSMTVHEGKEIKGSVQYSAVNKSDCGKANMRGHEEK